MRITPSLRLIGGGQTQLSSRFDCHVYAIAAPGGVILVDAGSGLGEADLLANLRAEFPHLDRGAILLTHAHPDHVCGAASLREKLQWPVYANALSRPLLEAGDEEASGLAFARSLGAYPAHLNLAPTPIDHTYPSAEPFDLFGLVFSPQAIRGHSFDSHVFAVTLDHRRCLFSADVFFYGGLLGVINAAGSSLAGYREDLPALAALDFDALFPSHGLFTLREGKRHLDAALGQLRQGFMPRTIGQGDLIF